jgi:2-furoyl-CoA dehydrogenase large subunit
VLGVPENKLRFIVPADIGGSFGIKSSMYPYIALIALAARKAGVPVKWIEDRREHLIASSSGTDRIAWRELAARKDGTVLGMRYKWYDNVGGYIRSPEPGCSFRPTGNFVGPYRFQNLEVDASVVMTNKSLTGPNRGYACGHLYFETEGMMDRLAEAIGVDPVEVRRRNFIAADQLPYRTPTGGLYDSGDYQATFEKALDIAKYDDLRREQARARAAGRYYGIGIAVAIDPSVSNMGYVATALDPQFRAKPARHSACGGTRSPGSGPAFPLARRDPPGQPRRAVQHSRHWRDYGRSSCCLHAVHGESAAAGSTGGSRDQCG